MRILEILLPKGTSDKSLSPQKIKKIDALQKRMTGYVDKICDPKTSKSGKEFLKAHLKTDYDEFKAAIKEIAITEANPKQQMSLYNPDGATYRGEQMPTLRPDPADNAEPLSSVPDDGYEEELSPMTRDQVIKKYMSMLPDRIAEVIKMRVFGEMTYQEIAEQMGVTRERIRQLEASGLRGIMKAAYIDRAKELSKIPTPNITNNATAGDVKYYEIYDKSTNKRVPGHIYKTPGKASNTAVFLGREDKNPDKYDFRPVGRVNESVNKLPLTDDDFEVVKRIMENPIPAAVASIYLIEIIDDDELNDQIRTLEDTEPNRDIRPFVVSWLDRVMPDQMHRFGQPRADENERKGLFSPIHGYDPHQYKGSNEALTGNAFGRV
jgi:RNA polymerase sigma factor (sigma-70 family)